ncbi:DUF1565 domain-containing protein [Fodinibius sp. SL11]|uniref:DUF1565 domain-containing protein n=1 Tax=Fodinibius sp. SL11 TaxID=3425690 RepID=UPI003F884CAA
MINKATLLCIVISLSLIFGCSDNSTGPDNNNDNGNEDNPPTASATADAGSNSDEVVGFEVIADGSGSSGSSSVSYSWAISSQPANSSASLSDADTENPSFIPDLPGEYTLQLEVTSDGESDTDEVVFSAIAKRLFVDANNGSDGDINGYMQDSPLKTITKALSVYDQNENDAFLDIDTIRVAEGVYDEANGESFPIDFSGNLIVKGDQNVDRSNIHILSPDVDRDPAIELGEGITLQHLHIENGYTGGSFNGDPDAVFIKSGTSVETSNVILEDVSVTMNAEEGVAISTGSSMNVEVRGFEGARNIINGKSVGQAYTNRFNTSDTRVHIQDTDVINMGDVEAFDMEDANNLNVIVTNTTVRPGASVIEPPTAFQINANNCSLSLDGVTVTTSNGTETGNRYQRALDMDADQPNSNIEVRNSTFQYTAISTIELYAADVNIVDSIIEGTNTEERAAGSINYLSNDGIKHLDGSLKVRGTTIRNIYGNAIAIGGPDSPNDNNFSVDLGTDGSAGNNVFENIDGWDIDLTRGSGDVSGEVPAIGNTWSNAAAPRCGADRSQPEDGEIQVSVSGNSLRWGLGSGEVCN